MPGRIWPSTQARRVRRAFTPTSLLVMPPLATTKAGTAVRSATQLWTASLMRTLRRRASSGVSFSRVRTARLVETQQVTPRAMSALHRAVMAAASCSRAPGVRTRSLFISMNSMPSTAFRASSWAVVFLVWEPTTMMPPWSEASVTISLRARRGRSEMFPRAFTRAAAQRTV